MTERPPPTVCIVGRKNAGKTEVTVALAAEMNRRGLRVMTAKHGHGFQLDQPGRDSWRHRHEGGAVRTVLAGPRDFAVLGAWPLGEMPLSELVSRFLYDADLVLAEGFKRSPAPKIEVIRADVHREPLFDPSDPGAGTVMAVVTDRDDLESTVPLFLLQDPAWVENLADHLEEAFSLKRSLESLRRSDDP